MRRFAILLAIACAAGAAALLGAAVRTPESTSAPSAQPDRLVALSAPALGQPAARSRLESEAPEPRTAPVAREMPPATARGPARTEPRAPAPPTLAPALAPAQLPIDPEAAVRNTLRLGQTAFEACYEHSLRRDNRVRGRIEVNLQVSAAGEVAQAKVIRSNVRDREVLGCIANRLRAMRFPPLGEDVEVTVPDGARPARAVGAGRLACRAGREARASRPVAAVDERARGGI
jgi:hypothetical protein